MGATTAEQTVAARTSASKDPLLRALQEDPHRAFTLKDFVRVLTPAAAKDPQKLAKAVEELSGNVQPFIAAGHVSEIGDGLYKARLFLDKESYIEHAFIGGMGNVHYRFRSPIFRLNIGVLSLFFRLDRKVSNWAVTIRDTTSGKDYSLTRRLSDGVYTIGSQPAQPGGADLQITGKYIEKVHLTITLTGDTVAVEDHKTLHGSRIDSLTEEGLRRYEAVARQFLDQTDPRFAREPVVRGRFVLDKLLQEHENYESGFFSTVVDWLLLDREMTTPAA